MRIDPKRFQRILVIGPSHYVPMENQISIADVTHYSTPLGLIEADTKWIERARKLPFIVCDPAAHSQEHSDQIQLPLIQSFISPKIPLVCMVCGQFDEKHLVDACDALRGLMDDKTLLVASSDFTHFGASFGYVPFKTDVQKNIETIDMSAFELFASKDVDGFLHYIKETGATICGRDPLALLITMMPEDAKVTRTGYDTSGRQLHDNSNSVSYVGALVEGSWTHPAVEKKEPSREPLCEADCQALLKIARDTIARAFKTKCTRPIWGMVPHGITPGMKSIRGGFVTLKENGELRGCIGEIVPRREVWKVVTEQALNAAFEDPRFEPLRPAELDNVEIEISLLTPPEPISSWKKIIIGKHGVVLRKNGYSAVFLPQVAPEQGWGIEETLSNLSLKAGLPADAWKTGADFLVFEAQVINEKKEKK